MITNMEKDLVLLIPHGFLPVEVLYMFNPLAVTAYRQAMVNGTFGSRAALKMWSGISNGGAKVVEPTGGGGIAAGSVLGGNLKSAACGRVLNTVADIAMSYQSGI
jgi:hypothetical protein